MGFKGIQILSESDTLSESESGSVNQPLHRIVKLNPLTNALSFITGIRLPPVVTVTRVGSVNVHTGRVVATLVSSCQTLIYV